MTKNPGTTELVKLDRELGDTHRFAKLIKSQILYSGRAPDSDISSMRSTPICLSHSYRPIGQRGWNH